MIDKAPASHYENVFFSPSTVDIMRRGNILTDSMNSTELLSELLKELAKAERDLGEKSAGIESTLTSLYDYIKRGVCILGSPLLTNIAAGRGTMSSCAAVPVKMVNFGDSELNSAEAYYRLNMGSGYDLTVAKDPVRTLETLNEHAATVEASGICERYIGNIAHVFVGHPRVVDFARAKVDREGLIHFNTSIDVSSTFMEAVLSGGLFQDLDGRELRARDLWSEIIESAWKCGDPGIISLERFNEGNPLSSISPYVTTAPCAEVGLAAGETCVFGYINLAACLSPGIANIDLDLIGDVAECLTRILDDAIESSIDSYPTPISAKIMDSKRKIGIGVCGYADTLLWMGVDYGCRQGNELLSSVLSVINYRSKIASARLAERRGSFPLFELSRYRTEDGFLGRFADFSTSVDRSDWRSLESAVASLGLRNSMTTALPPSGRSALVLGVNPSLEPFLSFRDDDAYVPPLNARIEEGMVEQNAAGNLTLNWMSSDTDWPRDAKSSTSLFRTATEVPAQEHLDVMEVAAKLVDDGISKTINLPYESSKDDVSEIFIRAWQAGLKAISVYRNQNSQLACRPSRCSGADTVTRVEADGRHWRSSGSG